MSELLPRAGAPAGSAARPARSKSSTDHAPAGVVRRKNVAGTLTSVFTSLVVHGFLLLCATLFYIEGKITEDEGAYMAEIRRPDAPKIDTMVEPPKPPKKNVDASAPEIPQEAGLVTEAGNAEEAGPAEGGEAGEGGDAGTRTLALADASFGAHGRPRGSYKPRAATVKGPKKSVDPYLAAAIGWLARHQEENGAWRVLGFADRCTNQGSGDNCARNELPGNEQYDVGVSALSLLAILGAGYSPSSKDRVWPAEAEESSASRETPSTTYGEVIRRACRFLVSVQDPSGRIGPPVDRFVYNHMLGTLALSEAYGLTGIWRLRKPVEKAVRFLLDSRSPNGGWRYSSGSSDADSSVTGWALIALKSAESSGFPIDHEVYGSIRKWFDQSSVRTSIPATSMGETGWDEKKTFLLTGYLGPRDAGRLVSVSGMNEKYAFTPALTALMLLSHLEDGAAASQQVKEGADTLIELAPRAWSADDKASWLKVDFHYLFHATYALSKLLPPTDPRWVRWKEAVVSSVFKTQTREANAGRCAEGSWIPIDRWSCEGGRVYMTAMGALAIELYHRFSRAPAAPKPPWAVPGEGG